MSGFTATADPAYRNVHAQLRAEQVLIDLVRIVPNGKPPRGNYMGISW